MTAKITFKVKCRCIQTLQASLAALALQANPEHQVLSPDLGALGRKANVGHVVQLDRQVGQAQPRMENRVILDSKVLSDFLVFLGRRGSMDK